LSGGRLGCSLAPSGRGPTRGFTTGYWTVRVTAPAGAVRRAVPSSRQRRRGFAEGRDQPGRWPHGRGFRSTAGRAG